MDVGESLIDEEWYSCSHVMMRKRCNRDISKFKVSHQNLQKQLCAPEMLVHTFGNAYLKAHTEGIERVSQ